MNDSEKQISENAIAYIKAHKKEIIAKVVGSTRSSPHRPISLFMAGSPGAGKTEFSKRMIPILERGGVDKIIRIDPDELRSILPGYNGGNSALFQGATAIGVEKMHDFVLQNNINFFLDGTFSNLAKARENIKRSLKQGRSVIVFYIFLDPSIAWDLTQKREALEGRNIPKEMFIIHLIKSYETVKSVKEEFGNKIKLFLVDKKSIDDMGDLTITEIKTNLADCKTMDFSQDTLLKIL